jgi:hypothetical protein
VVFGGYLSARASFRLDPGETGTRNPPLRVASYVSANFKNEKMNRIYILTILISITLIACKKADKDEVIKNDFAIAGELDSMSYKIFNLNDTISVKSTQAGHFTLDINHGDIFEINFDTYHTWIFGGTVNNYWCTMQVGNKIELLVDTTMKVQNIYSYKQYPKKGITYVDSTRYFRKDTIPKWIDKGEVIDKHGLWVANFSCKLAYWNEWVPSISDTLVTYGHSFYKGWVGLNDKYVAFRLLSSNDTLYGWLGMKVDDYDKIILGSYSYRKNWH